MSAILFLIFNRPDLTQQAFETIRMAAPSKLFVAADGARPDRPGEAALCARTRAIVEQVDWPCDVHTRFRDTNMGCRRAVSDAIGWFFDNVEEGIILEDDILVDPTFFQFAEQMLERYRDDPRVMSVTACNFQPDDRTYEASYYFSAYGHVWGWATWRRAWRHYDAELEHLTDRDAHAAVKRMGKGVPGFAHFWMERFWKVREGSIDSWAYVWTFSQWLHGGLCVTPRVNMVENVGFGTDATHTQSANAQGSELRAVPLLGPLVHPDDVARDVRNDAHVSRTHYRFKAPRLKRRLELWLRSRRRQINEA